MRAAIPSRSTGSGRGSGSGGSGGNRTRPRSDDAPKSGRDGRSAHAAHERKHVTDDTIRLSNDLESFGLFDARDAAQILSASTTTCRVRLPDARKRRGGGAPATPALSRVADRAKMRLLPPVPVSVLGAEGGDHAEDGQDGLVVAVFGSFPLSPSGLAVPATGNEALVPTVPTQTRRAWAKLPVPASTDVQLESAITPVRTLGLINAGNQCFAHAVLQSLVTSPLIFASLRDTLRRGEGGDGALHFGPVTAAVARFLAEYATAAYKDSGRLGAVRDRPLAPSYIFDVLHEQNFTTKGRQEDAEEFLSYLLDGLDSELVAGARHADGDNGCGADGQRAGSEPLPQPRHDKAPHSRADDDWEEVGRRNRTSTRRVAGFAAGAEGGFVALSAVDRLFGGRLRSVVQRRGSKASITVQPFRVLPLDIQSDDVTCVEDALRRLASVEDLGGVTSERTQLEVAATRTLSFEALPRILVLHLKRFYFDVLGGAAKKFTRHITFKETLIIPEVTLTPSIRAEDERVRSYTLFAVVRHRGQGAAGGHYVCDVRHEADGWVHCDDSNVTRIASRSVLAEEGGSPYLLFYAQGQLGSREAAESAVPLSDPS